MKYILLTSIGDPALCSLKVVKILRIVFRQKTVILRDLSQSLTFLLNWQPP